MILPKFITIFFQSIVYLVTFIFFRFFIRLQVKGLDNVLFLHGGVILASNHTSEWDGLLIRASLPLLSLQFSPLYYVARTTEYYKNSGWRQFFYGGFIFKLVGAYPVHSGKKDYEYSLNDFIKLLKLKSSVCIFPEGAKNSGMSVTHLHGGVAFLSSVTDTPVVPVAIKWLPSSKNAHPIFPRVLVTFGKLILPDELNNFEPGCSIDFYKQGTMKVLNKIYGML